MALTQDMSFETKEGMTTFHKEGKLRNFAKDGGSSQPVMPKIWTKYKQPGKGCSRQAHW